MRRRYLWPLLLLSTPASAQSYLPQTNGAACLARSATQAAALGTDGVQTKYWWPCQPLTAAVSGNVTALVIRPGDSQFGSTTTNLKVAVPTGLSTAEQAALVPRATMGTLLPDIISEVAFKARFTPTQITAMGASSDTAIKTTWANLGASAAVDLEGAAIQAMLSAAVVDGIITQPNYLAITTPVATATQ